MRDKGQTSVAALNDTDLQRLQIVYQQVTEHSASSMDFARAVAKIDWTTKPAEVLEPAINMAIALDGITIARQLAQIGRDRFPDDTRLSGLWRVLQPPRVIETNRPPKKGLSASIEWLQHHANEYRGYWVALVEGRLVGTDISRAALIEKLGDVATLSNILITWIP